MTIAAAQTANVWDTKKMPVIANTAEPNWKKRYNRHLPLYIRIQQGDFAL